MVTTDAEIALFDTIFKNTALDYCGYIYSKHTVKGSSVDLSHDCLNSHYFFFAECSELKRIQFKQMHSESE